MRWENSVKIAEKRLWVIDLSKYSALQNVGDNYKIEGGIQKQKYQKGNGK